MNARKISHLTSAFVFGGAAVALGYPLALLSLLGIPLFAAVIEYITEPACGRDFLGRDLKRVATSPPLRPWPEPQPFELPAAPSSPPSLPPPPSQPALVEQTAPTVQTMVDDVDRGAFLKRQPDRFHGRN